MRQKTILMHFLHLGSIMGVLLLVFGCEPKVDGLMYSKWCFVNESAHKIEVQSQDRRYSFTLEASQSHSFKMRCYIGSSNANETSYPVPYISGDKIIVDDGPTHVLAANEGIFNKSNYKWEKIGWNDYRFTYVFTDENIAELTKPAEPAEPEAVDK